MSRSSAAKKQAPLAAVPLAKNDHDDDIKFRVRDPGAHSGARRHIMLDENGREVPFNFLDPHGFIECPYRYAIKFARIAEFEVLDNHGRRIRAVVNGNNHKGIQLSNNEVIAQLEELTVPALLERANKAGGSFKGNSSRESLTAFLKDMAGLRIEGEKENEGVLLESEEGMELGEDDDLIDGFVDEDGMAAPKAQA